MDTVKSIAYLLLVFLGFGPVNTATIKSTSLQSVHKIECGRESVLIAKLTPVIQEKLRLWLEAQITKPQTTEWSLVSWSVAPAKCRATGNGFQISFYENVIFYTFNLEKYNVSYRRSSLGALTALNEIITIGDAPNAVHLKVF